MANRWYVLCCKMHKEHVLSQTLTARGYDVYCPRFFVNAVDPRAVKTAPFFPGYLFIKLDLETVSPTVLQRIPFSDGLVCFGEKPGHVPDQLVGAIRSRLEKDGNWAAERLAEPETGAAGSLEFFNPHASSDERVHALMTMLQGISLAGG